MIRELEEETWIKVRDIQFVKTYFERYPDMDFTYHKYKVVLDELPIITLNPDEHSNYAWFTPQEALEHTLITGEDEIIRDIFNIE